MNTPVSIPEELLARFANKNALLCEAQIRERIAALIEHDLRDPDIDVLTGCRSRDRLIYDLTNALDEAIRRDERYSQTFLCCDIDDFANYLDHHGFGVSDDRLIQLSQKLKSTGKPVYRYGGDEFVVQGLAAPVAGLDRELDVAIRQNIVRVELQVVASRRNRARSWILSHLIYGLVRPVTRGAVIDCREPDEWKSG